MTGLDERQRGVLERIVVSSRITMEDDLASILKGDYGIGADGGIEDEDRLADDSSLRRRRRTLVEVVDYLRRDGSTGPEAFARLVREAAFTHINRLIAIRVADALDVLPPSLRSGPASAGFKQVLELAPLLATSDDTGGYWAYLQLCADELARDVPALFDPRNPLLALRPTKPAIDAVVERLSANEHAEVWAADDTFGWAYQFFNTGDERRLMREGSSAPRDSRELAVRNQFFTPRYVVDFLTQNTLGRRLLDGEPDSGLLEQLPLIVDPPVEVGEPVTLEEVRVLDPACGSGHFLLGCYEILERAWALKGTSARDAASRIVPCLWGIDIDSRAVQVAQAAVIFRARKACGNDPLPPPNIVTARALPDDEAIWATATAGMSIDRRHLVAAMRTALADAPILGPLLKAEVRLSSEIRTTVPGGDPSADDLFAAAGISSDAFGSAEREVIGALQRVADLAESSVADRLLAASAGDAIRFLEAIRHRYDAVLMNPPFGEPVPETKGYLRAAYSWIPTRDFNLLAAFVGRGIELCRPAGYMGAITSRAGMFLKTFEDWRTQVLLGHRMTVLADLGFGVMEQAMVEAAAYVVSPRPPSHDHAGVYIRLLKDTDRPGALKAAIAADRTGGADRRVFRVGADEFAAIPGSPLAYWMGSSIRQIFTDHPPFQGAGGDVRVGLQTGDDFRFLRLAWEVDPKRVSAVGSSGRWVPFAKGGDYSPYWSDLHLLVDWERDGEGLREFAGSVIRNPQYYFRSGLTWPPRTNSAFAPRVLPEGAAFGHKGPAIFSTRPLSALAWMSSRVVQAGIDAMVAAGEETVSGGASRSYEVGLVQNLPWPLEADDGTALDRTMRELIRLASEPDKWDETTHQFLRPLALGPNIHDVSEDAQRAQEDRSLAMLEASLVIDEHLLDQLGIDDAGRNYLNDEVGTHPLRYPKVQLDETVVGPMLSKPMDQIIDELVETVGGSRSITTLGHVADRRLEVLAHAFHVHPEKIIELRRRRGDLPPQALQDVSARLISWLVGVAFGRWDVRPVAPGGDFDPFSPLPVCPPGMLVGPDGFPADHAPPNYPLSLPADGVLLDEPGRGLDLAAAVEDAARVAMEGGEELLADAVRTLGRRSLQEYLAKQFFKDHLSTYSKSRRQAPVYWQLVIPSAGWSAWMYAPRLSREMFFAVVREADRRLAAGADRVRKLESEQPGSGSNARQVAKMVDAERTLMDQLGELRVDVARIAGIGWEPDLDDGFVLCAAPFSRWFPKNTWKQTGESLAKLRSGEYDWSSIHRYREQL